AEGVTIHLEIFAFTLPSKKVVCIVFQHGDIDADAAKEGFDLIAGSFAESDAAKEPAPKAPAPKAPAPKAPAPKVVVPPVGLPPRSRAPRPRPCPPAGPGGRPSPPHRVTDAKRGAEQMGRHDSGLGVRRSPGAAPLLCRSAAEGVLFRPSPPTCGGPLSEVVS